MEPVRAAPDVARPATRHIVSDFVPFQMTPGTRFQDTHASHFAPAPAAAYRQQDTNEMDDDDDAFVETAQPVPTHATENEVRVVGDNGQELAYRHDPVSLAQARRLAMQSVSRGGARA